MEISYNQLKQAFENIDNLATIPEPDGMTAQELGTILNLSRDATRQYIKSQLNTGKLKHVMVWRVTIGGYRARTHGYQLV